MFFFSLHPLGYEWEKLWIGNPAGVFIAYFLSGRWHCSSFKKGKGRKISVGIWQTSFKGGLAEVLFCIFVPHKAKPVLFLSRAVLLWTFPFPRKGFWHNVVLIKADFCSILFSFFFFLNHNAGAKDCIHFFFYSCCCRVFPFLLFFLRSFQARD